MSGTIFPFAIRCSEDGHSDYRFRTAFMAAKPKDLVWFAYDVIVHSPVHIEFEVYGMLDNVRGGVGDKIASLPAKVNPSVTEDVIEKRIKAKALERRIKEIQDAEAIIIDSYVHEIRKEIYQ